MQQTRIILDNDKDKERPGRFRVGVIGVGFGQHVHVPAFRQDARADVAIICASTEERAEAVASRLGIRRATGAWQAVCADPAIDIVAISVPAALQPTIVRAAAEAGKHVFCEKPLAVDVPAAVAALDAVSRAKVVHAIDFEFRVIPAWVRAREICISGVLGPLRKVALTWHVETLAYREKRESWKVTAAQGGGALHLFGSHVFDSLAWIFGTPTLESARLGLSPPERGDARVEAWLKLPDGTAASVSIAADAFCGVGHRLEVYGDDGTLLLDNPTSDYVNGFRLSVASRKSSRLEEVVAPVTTGADGRVTAVGTLVSKILDDVERRATGAGAASLSDYPTLQDGLRSLELAEAVRNHSRRAMG